MKKVLMYLLLTILMIINVYLVFFWNPQDKGITKEVVSKEVFVQNSLYKIDRYKILDQLSSDDKREFEKIVKKLSSYDIGLIKQYYENPDEEEGLVNIFKVLKRRLAVEDYRRIEEISSQFFDLDKINEKIKK
jgi:hypothetical protein